MGLEWQIKDSDWAQMILKLSVNLNMRKSGLAGQKMFLTRFNKIFWSENVCALSACLSEKQMRLYLITGQSAPHLSVIKATEQKWEEIGLYVDENVFLPQIGLKNQTGRNTVEMQVFLWRNVSLMLPYREL